MSEHYIDIVLTALSQYGTVTAGSPNTTVVRTTLDGSPSTCSRVSVTIYSTSYNRGYEGLW